MIHIRSPILRSYLVCQIPNLLGAFYPFLWFCARDYLKLHNCALMREDLFRRIFDRFGLDVKFCWYLGAPQFRGLPLMHECSLRWFAAAAALDRLQDFLDHGMFLFCRGDFPRSHLSAYLAFVGQRTSWPISEQRNENTCSDAMKNRGFGF